MQTIQTCMGFLVFLFLVSCFQPYKTNLSSVSIDSMLRSSLLRCRHPLNFHFKKVGSNFISHFTPDPYHHLIYQDEYRVLLYFSFPPKRRSCGTGYVLGNCASSLERVSKRCYPHTQSHTWTNLYCFNLLLAIVPPIPICVSDVSSCRIFPWGFVSFSVATFLLFGYSL